MKKQTYYVIRHKPTGRLLPARVLATHYDFDSPNCVLEPRLFNSERAAKNCATFWAQGVWVQKLVKESEGWEYRSYMIRDLPSPRLVSDRKREDLEVLAVVLSIKTGEKND